MASKRREPRDFRLLIGPEPFDPKESPPRPRQPATAGAGTGPSDAGAAPRQATIVQFTAALSPPDVDRLRDEWSLSLDRYIPNLAYLERLTADTVSRLRGDFLVRACIDLDPTLKLAPWIRGAGAQPEDDASPVHDFYALLFDDAQPHLRLQKGQVNPGLAPDPDPACEALETLCVRRGRGQRDSAIYSTPHLTECNGSPSDRAFASLSGNSRHGAMFGSQRSALIDPSLPFDDGLCCNAQRDIS